MSDQFMITLQAALQQLAIQHTEETLGDRATYLGVSEIGACPRKTILSKIVTVHQDFFYIPVKSACVRRRFRLCNKP